MFVAFISLSLLAQHPPVRDAPVRAVLVAQADSKAAPPDISPTLQNARRLAEELRYEEAVVEYQRYLGEPVRPVKERARALLELGFLHLILGDEVNAQRRAIEALELDPGIKPPAEAPLKQQQFLEKVREVFAERPRFDLEPPKTDDPPDLVRTHLSDPKGKVRRVLLRHSLGPNGPFYSTPMSCNGDECQGHIPPPRSGNDFTAWYYVEGLDDLGGTVGQAASPGSPVQVSIAGLKPWYSSPWVWGVSGAAIISAAAIYFIAASPSAAK